MNELMVKERCLNYGGNSLFDNELLSVVLGISSEKADVILKAFGGLNGLINSQLDNFKGLSKSAITKLKAMIEMNSRINKNSNNKTIRSPQDVYNLVEDIKNLDREHFKTILVNTKNKVITIETVSIGTLSSSLVHPREVFKNAIKLSAASIIIVHNHPSGNPHPSKEDKEVTRKLSEIGKLIGIEVLDHIIIGKDGYVSLKETGII